MNFSMSGKKRFTMSVSSGKSIAIVHDLRTRESVIEARRKNPDAYSNVDVECTDDNIILKSCKTSVEHAFNDIFENAVQDYNQGKKPSRQIGNYYDKCLHDKRMKLPFVDEIVVQLGNRDEHPDDELAVEILEDFYQHFSDLSGIEVMCSSIHLDESTPHLHISYAFISEKNRGLKKQAGMRSAMKEMGFDDSKTADPLPAQWSNFLRDELEDVSASHGVYRKDGKSAGRKRDSVDVYKQKMQELDERERKVQMMEHETKQRRNEAQRVRNALVESYSKFKSFRKKAEDALDMIDSVYNSLLADEIEAEAAGFEHDNNADRFMDSLKQPYDELSEALYEIEGISDDLSL